MTDTLEKLDGTGKRLLKLRKLLQAREGHPEYVESVETIKAEINRLETRPAIKEFDL